MNTRRCDHCGERLGARHAHNARYCSGRCRTAACRKRRTIPAELTSRPRWIRRTSRKVPVTVGGDAASSTDPATWSRYSDAAKSSAGAGLGFVLDGDGVVCLDLDHCLDDEGAAAGWAQGVLDAVGDSAWVEVSQGGDGLHIWGYGELPGDAGRRLQLGDGTVEVYGDGRYIAVTGVTFGGTPQRLGDLQYVIDSLLQGRAGARPIRRSL
ncbi:bifunctional DNA primase/polymerase [Streptomyces mirabilis]|uniref:bifunctional DNA primase/polymerase n=1 Tax=Streptomyces mirabilis TaxID=68239 RepID=UPI002259677A|nr:bifunctional DNA primase/polymerase [Streptomyces mirabilis]MCX4606976.1 DNA primase [Streptomyces mirabilis]